MRLNLCNNTGSVNLTELIEQAKGGDKKAREFIINAFTPLVGIIAKKMCARYRHTTLDDLIQDGVIGLMKAIEGYDPHLGKAEFKTYAACIIRSNMRHAYFKQFSNIKQPGNIPSLYKAIVAFETKYFSEHNKYPPYACIARHIGVTEDCIIRTKSICAPIVSLNSSVGPEDDTELEEIISDNSGKTIEDEACGNILTKEVLDLLQKFEEPVASYVRLYFGLNGVNRLPYAEIGEIFNVTGENVRREVRYALKKMKHMKEFKALLNFVE